MTSKMNGNNNNNDPQFDKMWPNLESAIKEIQQKRKTSNLDYVELYGKAYDLVISKKCDKMVFKIKQAVQNHLLKNVSTQLQNALNNDFLTTMVHEWNDHKLNMLMIRDIFIYLDKYLLSHCADQAEQETVYHIGVALFGDVVAKSMMFKEKLRVLLLQSIYKERSGELVNRMDLKHASNMLVDLGLGKLDVYVDVFEISFLRESAVFFESEHQKYKTENSVAAYVEMVRKWLHLEKDRATAYLHATSINKVTELVRKTLVEGHMAEILEMGDGAHKLIEDGKFEDLQTLHELFSVHDGGSKLVLECLFDYLNARISKTFPSENATRTASSNVAVNVVKELLAMVELCDKFVDSVFNKNYATEVEQELKKVLRNQAKCSEYISIYTDRLLRSSGKSLARDEDIEASLDKAVKLLTYLEDLVRFEEYYKVHLSKRLIGEKSIDLDMEKNMVSKIKRFFGWMATNDLEEMLRDYEVADDLDAEFKDHCSDNNLALGFDIKVTVLRLDKWPLKNDNTDVTQPLVVRNEFEKFLMFYTSKFFNRNLHLNAKGGNAEMKMLFYKENSDVVSRTQIITIPTQSMFVLLLFNEHASWSFEAIQAATNINEGPLKTTIAQLLWSKSRLLIKEPDCPQKREILPTDMFMINESFKSSSHKVTIKQAAEVRDPSAEFSETEAVVEKRRSFELDACIVRIMKARKQIKHSDLMLEVATQLIPRFRPEPAKIKTAISLLIEKEYIARDPNQLDVYNYLT